jgi:hypothetical protein
MDLYDWKSKKYKYHIPSFFKVLEVFNHVFHTDRLMGIYSYLYSYAYM